MAELPVNLNQGVDLAGTTFVQQGYAQPDVSAMEQLKNLAGTGLDAFSKYKMEQAEMKSKSLLEEFTGYKRKSALDEEIGKLDDQEASIREQLGTIGPGNVRRDTSMAELATLEQTRDNLIRDREAVDQGLLSYEEYRRRAEKLFYEQVVHTPGLKQDIAKVMNEFLGLDPRGEEAAIEIEKRKALMKTQADELKTFRSDMRKSGFWDLRFTPEENVQRFGQAFLDMQQLRTRREFRRENFNDQQAYTTAEREAQANQRMKELSDLSGPALSGMGRLGEVDIWTIKPAEWMNMDPELVDNWVNHVNTQALALIDEIKSEQYMNPELKSERVQPLIDSITDRRDLLLGMIRATEGNEQYERQAQRLKNEHSIRLEYLVKNIHLSQPDALMLEAMRVMWGESNLTNRGKIETLMLQLMNGGLPDLSGGLEDPTVQDTLASYQEILKSSRNYLDSGQEFDEQQWTAVRTTMNSLSRTFPDELNSETRQQMQAMAAREDIMKKYEAEDAKGYANFMRAAMLSQEHELEEAKGEFSLRGVKPSQYHLTKEDGVWMITPTSIAQTDIPKRTGQASRKSATERRLQDNQQRLRDAVKDFNTQRGYIGNMITARVRATGMSETYAAADVARALGLNLSDVKVKPQVGFAEEAGVE